MKSIIETKMELIKDRLNTLTNNSNFEYDGMNDNRIFMTEQLNVHAPALGKTMYKAMEKKIQKFYIDNDLYTIYASNDVSGFDYWNRDDENNYIMFACAFKDVEKLNVDSLDLDKINDDFNECNNEFEEFETFPE